MNVQAPAQQQPPVVQPSEPAQQAQPAAPVNEEVVTNLMAISGRARDHVVRSLELASGNADVAFELCTLEPSQLEAMASQAAQQQHMDMGDDFYEEDEEEGSGMAINQDFAAFVNNPNFESIRERIIQNPMFF